MKNKLTMLAEKAMLEEILLSENIRQELDEKEKTIFKIIPELKKENGFDHKHPHHSYDVWEHTKVALEKSDKDLEVRLALLLHDIGKPYSYQEDKEIRHYRGHAEKGEKITNKVLNRLEYGPKQIKDICYLVKKHDEKIDVNNLDTYDMELLKKRLHMQYCDAYAHNPKFVAKRIEILDEVKNDINNIEESLSKVNEKYPNNKEKNKKGKVKEILAVENVEDMDEKSLFELIPELKDEVGFDQKNPYHVYDVWNHTKNAMKMSKNDPNIRMTLLLHDIGKPHSYQEDGEIRHFKGHPKKSAKIAENILDRLDYEKEEKEEILFLVEKHATRIDTNKVNEKNLELNKKLLYIQYCDNSAYAPKYAKQSIEKLDVIKEELTNVEKKLNIDNANGKGKKVEEER